MRKKILNESDIGKIIGHKLYAILEQKGLSQTEIANKLGITPQSVSQLLSGRLPSGNINRYKKIADVIPLSTKEFDEIVVSAKKEIVGVKETQSEPTIEVAKATLKKHYGLDTDSSDEELALRLIKEKYHS